MLSMIYYNFIYYFAGIYEKYFMLFSTILLIQISATIRTTKSLRCS